MHEKQRNALLRELAQTAAGADFTCGSGSMLPTIRVGEHVRVRAVPLASLRVGDVVVYKGSLGVYMLHRIAWISPSRVWFLHIGDADLRSGARKAPCSAIVGRTNHPWRAPKKRALLLALPEALMRRGKRYLRGAS